MSIRAVHGWLVVVLLAAAAVPAPADAAEAPMPSFTVGCRFSHRLSDDPIVAPGRPGAAHSHDFFGNTTTSAHSTNESIRAGDSTCSRPHDRSAYWTPSLFDKDNGQVVAPVSALLYYKSTAREHSKVIPIPAGLRVIAGDAHAIKSQAPVVMWRCANGAASRIVDEPMCSSGERLQLRIAFPDCWDGRRLDSADHQSHMAYSLNRTCPHSHPWAVPQITVFVQYPTTVGTRLTLASGGVHSGHADFVNGWDQKMQRRLVRGCLNADHHCGGNKTPNASTTPTAEEQRAAYMYCSFQRRRFC